MWQRNTRKFGAFMRRIGANYQIITSLRASGFVTRGVHQLLAVEAQAEICIGLRQQSGAVVDGMEVREPFQVSKGSQATGVDSVLIASGCQGNAAFWPVNLATPNTQLSRCPAHSWCSPPSPIGYWSCR